MSEPHKKNLLPHDRSRSLRQRGERGHRMGARFIRRFWEAYHLLAKKKHIFGFIFPHWLVTGSAKKTRKLPKYLWETHQFCVFSKLLLGVCTLYWRVCTATPRNCSSRKNISNASPKTMCFVVRSGLAIRQRYGSRIALLPWKGLYILQLS